MSDFKMDMTPLNAEQMVVMKKLIEFGQNWAEQVKTIMVHHNLWHKGFRIQMEVDPRFSTLQMEVKVHRKVIEGDGIYDEQIERYRGPDLGDVWKTLPPCTSREFIHLFDGEENRSGEEEGTASEKPLPADGLWIGDPGDTDTVDGGQ